MEWSDKSVLKSIKNTCPNHSHILDTPELSFLGFPEQPDYAKISIEMHPKDTVFELKSVKHYLMQFREKHISYERLLNCIINDFWDVYSPNYLCVIIETRPRGGIASKLTVRRMR